MTDRDARLVAAVRAGDLPEVHALLGPGRNPDAVDEDGLPVLCAAVAAHEEEIADALLGAGADPEAVDADGTPVLCTAVAAFAYRTVAALVRAGADPDRVLPDGTTPLLRAVEGGSPATVKALLWSQDLQAPELRLERPMRERLLAAARHWYETGAETELRRRTGATAPARIVTVEEEWSEVEQVTLGGPSVRAGHGAVLTVLESTFGVPAPFPELVARAVRHPDPVHVDWAAARFDLGEGARDAVTALRHHPSAHHRRFAADWLGGRLFLVKPDAYAHLEDDRDLLATWAETETDAAVLAEVLWVLTEHAEEHPRLEAVGLRYADHPAPQVRRRVPDCLARPLTARATAALRALTRDPDDEVRFSAALALPAADHEDRDGPGAVVRDLVRDPHSPMRGGAAEALAVSDDRTADAAEVLLALLDTDDRILRLVAAYGLALRDHPYTPQAYARVEELGPIHQPDHRAFGLEDWRRRNEPPA
ncbi:MULTISPECIES: ankyrin repeat domain-containing protein [unclassified Streptomyces]|uniref:ankyrin repeat domain-containing protein n=1 Tax=unclassified Streptomyces TaxID=2593676 RepID=UPI00068E37BE|nr:MULTISPECIES: HEAT repeat domain-containing protein [unclassified Streptomyces]